MGKFLYGLSEEGSLVQIALFGPSKFMKLNRPNGQLPNLPHVRRNFGPFFSTVVGCNCGLSKITVVDCKFGNKESGCCNMHCKGSSAQYPLLPSSWVTEICQISGRGGSTQQTVILTSLPRCGIEPRTL